MEGSLMAIPITADPLGIRDEAKDNYKPGDHTAFLHNWLEGQYEKLVKALLHFQHVEDKQTQARKIIQYLKGEIHI
jgi:hypothetical protein